MIGSGERTGDAQVHQSVEPLEKVDRRTPPASSGLTGRLQRAHRRWLHPTAAATSTMASYSCHRPGVWALPAVVRLRCPNPLHAAVRRPAEVTEAGRGWTSGATSRAYGGHPPAAAAGRTLSPRSHPRPFGQHHPSERQRTTAAMAAAAATPPSPRQPPCGSTGHPPKRSGHATGVAARLVSAEAVDDQRPSQRYRRSSPGVRGKAALSGQAGEGATATGHRPQADAAANTAVHHMAQLGQLGFYFASGGRSIRCWFRLVTTSSTLPQGRPCGRPPPAAVLGRQAEPRACCADHVHGSSARGEQQPW